MTNQSIRETLLAAIREIPGRGGKYVFTKDIPQPYRDQFQRDTAGQTATLIDGEVAYFDYDFMAWLNRSYSHIRLKHMGSSAADLVVNFQIDTANCVVSLQANAFDSALIADFLERVLLQRNGIVAIRDDRTEWNPERPPYRVFLTLHGQRYEVTAHRLMKEVGGGITVVLEPVAETDAAIMHALYTLKDFPVLAELAAKRTQVKRLDGRTCRAVYDAALHDIDWQAVPDHEREFMRQLGVQRGLPPKATEQIEALFKQHSEVLKGLADYDAGREP